jgi:hypothetical protein
MNQESKITLFSFVTDLDPWRLESFSVGRGTYISSMVVLLKSSTKEATGNVSWVIFALVQEEEAAAGSQPKSAGALCLLAKGEEEAEAGSQPRDAPVEVDLLLCATFAPPPASA